MSDPSPAWDELKPLDTPFKGHEDCYTREDASGKYVYAREPTGEWLTWNPQINQWQRVLPFFGDILQDYVRRYLARRENIK